MSHSWRTRYAIAILAPALAFALRGPLLVLLPSLHRPFLLLMPAITISAYFGGLGPGLLSTALGSATAIFFFVPPVHRFSLASSASSERLMLFLLEGVLLAFLCELLHRSRRKAEESAAALAREVQGREALEVTLRQRAEELAHADRAKDQFLAMLAHELRNPLAPIRHAVQFLQQVAPPDPRTSRAREIIDRQVRHQARLIDDLLDVSRISRGKIRLHLEPLDLAPLVRDTTEDCRSVLEAAGLQLSLQLPAEPVWVDGDATRLAQVISNLLQNAAKFTDPGGQVTVTLGVEPANSTRRHGDTEGDTEGNGRRDEGAGTGSRLLPNSVLSDSVSPCLRGENPVAYVTVQDTGIGIDPRVLPHVFDTFSQADQSLDRSRGGLGLGLALVKGLAELHGGDVRAESEGVGRGAAFTVCLPVREAGVAPAAAPSPAVRSTGPLRVLVVEDNRDAAESLRDLLELAGCDVAVGYSGLEAVTLASQFRPAVVLCDLGLPGLDGYSVAAALRRDPVTAGTRLIAISGYGQEEDLRRSREAGFDEHLVKPVDFAALQGLLEAGPAVALA